MRMKFERKRPRLTLGLQLLLGSCVLIAFYTSSQKLTFQTRTVVKGDPTSYTALCVLAKDEHSNIVEWLLHHYSIGVKRFYVHDDNSNPHMRAVLQDFIDAGLVDYELLLETLKPKDPTLIPKQMIAMYERCLEKARSNGNTFAGFIDVDEFLMLRNSSETIDTLLRDYEGFGGLAVNWRMFGSSGHVARPPIGTLQSYTACSTPDNVQNTHVKSFVNTRKAKTREIHHFDYINGSFAVNTAYRRVDGPFSSPAVFDRAVLHHYLVRSREDFDIKQRRGLPAGNAEPRGEFFFSSINNYTIDTCTDAVAVGQRLYARFPQWLQPSA